MKHTYQAYKSRPESNGSTMPDKEGNRKDSETLRESLKRQGYIEVWFMVDGEYDYCVDLESL